MEAKQNLGVELYVDLLKRCVSNTIYNDDLDVMRGSFKRDPVTGKLSSTAAALADGKRKYFGGIWPTRAHTMIGIPVWTICAIASKP